MKEEELNQIYSNYLEFISSEISLNLSEFHKSNLKYISEFSSHYDNLENELINTGTESDSFSKFAALHRSLENITHKQKAVIDKELIFTLYESIESFFNDQSQKLSAVIELDQKPEHFSSSNADSAYLKSLKKIKSISFKISKRGNKLKNKSQDYTWKRKVPIKNLHSHYYLHNFLNGLLKSFEEYIENVGKSFITAINEQKITDTSFTNSLFTFLKDTQENDFNSIHQTYKSKIIEIKNNLDLNFQELLSSINDLLIEQSENLKKDFRVIGTVELSFRKFNNNRILKELSAQKSKLEKSKNNYHSFSSAVFDRVEYYEDLSWFSCQLISNSFNIQKYSNPFLNKIISQIINSISDTLKQSVLAIDNSSTNLISQITKEQKSLRKDLDENYVPTLINKVTSNNVSKVLNEYLKKLEQYINEFDKNYNFIRPKSLVYRIDHDQLKTFSPKEIISPIVLKKLSNSIELIIKEFNGNISKLNSNIIGLAQIAEYSLESAKLKFKDENSLDEAVQITNEGLNRSITKTEDYFHELKSIMDNTSIQLAKEISDLLEDLFSLSNIDRLITIKLQVSKEKTIQEAKEKFSSYYAELFKWFVWLKRKSISVFSASKEKFAGISSKVGLGADKVELSEAMADYLVRVSESLEKLPYVYQRLFSNDQLSDDRIFIGRELESSKLEKAFSYWVNNQIASVMLIGEKGSGTSSIINVVLKRFDEDAKVLRKEFGGTIYTQDELLVALRQIFELPNVKSFEELVDIIKNFDERKIVIIENIENFYLRTIDGFAAIIKLLEVISSTSSKLLWITTCNVYSWNYLKRVININDYFIFNIHVQELNKNIVENIIMSRHNVSGYKLEFIPTEEIENQKSYKKLSPTEKQEFLKKEYFELLTELTSNNIAVGLFLWLRSVKKADEEKIQVSTNIELDFSFLKSLSNEKLFTLMAIILHDGLTREEHAKIFNTSVKFSKMLFATLADDGIIFNRNDIYKINFQLYKPIISLLKDKNILH